MTLIRRAALAVSVALLLTPSAASAQAPVVGAGNPEALFTSPDPRLHANKQVVLHIVRDLLEANHWADAGRYLSDDYIQHNPNVASGLAPVMQFFGGRTPAPIPAADAWRTKVVAVTAEGDLVSVAYVRVYPDPRTPGKIYTTTWFDLWRIRDGKAVEHWDPATIAAPAPAR
jgi:predicted SnoaL-like aldol condensation-catalyzing enzyme